MCELLSTEFLHLVGVEFEEQTQSQYDGVTFHDCQQISVAPMDELQRQSQLCDYATELMFFCPCAGSLYLPKAPQISTESGQNAYQSTEIKLLLRTE